MSGNEPSGARKAFGDVAPTFVDLIDDVLFGRVWPRLRLAKDIFTTN